MVWCPAHRKWRKEKPMRSRQRKSVLSRTSAAISYKFQTPGGWREQRIIAVEEGGERRLQSKPMVIPALGDGPFGWGKGKRLESCRAAAAVLHDATDGDREIVHVAYALLARERFFEADGNWEMSADHLMAWLVPALTRLETWAPTDAEWLLIQKMRRRETEWGSLIGMTVREVEVKWEKHRMKCPAEIPEELARWVLTHEFAGAGVER